MSYTTMNGFGQPPGGSTRAPTCSNTGNYAPLQQMLADLGYYFGPIDGTMSAGGPTQQAAQQFARAEGMDQYAPIDNAFCERLIQRWGEQQSGGQTAPPGTPNGKPAKNAALLDPGARFLTSRGGSTEQGPTQDPPPPADAPNNKMLYLGAGILGLLVVGGAAYYMMQR